MAAGAQGLLRGGQLPQREHGHTEAVFHIVLQHLLPGPPLAQVEQVLFLPEKLPAALFRRAAAGLAQAAQGVPAHQPAPLLVPVEHIPPGPGGPLAVGDAPPGAAEVAVEQGLHPVFQLLLIQPRGKGEGVQHPPLPVVLRPGLPQGPLEPGTAEVVQALPDSLVPPPGHGAGGVFPPQRIQHRPVLTGTAVDRPLQSQPEQVGVQLAAELALEGVEQGLEAAEVVVVMDQADDRVEIQVGPALRVEGVEIRADAVVLRPVPHLVVCTAGLNVLPVHLRLRTGGPGPRPGGCGSTPRRPPAGAQRGQRPC